uniref:Uncharacterized protein n=1 Tax=Pipistrellus kuhlii TaxID=59472 RepID=A0A7J7UGM2_PIPKU|nr:hypothetical protein mPipKuh1_009125 [Pipistrellus kuhlii]
MSRHLSPQTTHLLLCQRAQPPLLLAEEGPAVGPQRDSDSDAGTAARQPCPHGHRSSPAPPPRPARRSWGLSGQPRCTVKTIRHVVLHEEAGVDRGTPWICAKAREAVAPGQAAGDGLKPGRGLGSLSTAVRGVASVAVMLPKPLVCP